MSRNGPAPSHSEARDILSSADRRKGCSTNTEKLARFSKHKGNIILLSLVRSATFFEPFSHLTGHDKTRFTAVGSEQQSQVKDMVNYTKDNPDISDVLITGGYPMVMRTAQRTIHRYHPS
jgi:hypothetical protein